ncbi:MAG: cyanophycin synthetase, partial [Candidatus Omnitrophota bacterium]
ARQAPEVARVITKRCQTQGAPLFACGTDFKTSDVELKNNRTRFDFHSGTISISGINTGLRGKYQVENIALGLQAIALASPKGFCANAVKKGIRRTQLAGRFETLCRAPLTVVDIAHNPSAFNALKENLARYYPDRKVILIFAASRDKDIKNMLNKFPYTHLILTRFDNPRAFDPRSIREVCGVRSQATIAANIKEAYCRARRFYGPGALILIAGSFFLAAEAKKLLRVKSIHPRGPARIAQ